MQTILIIEDEPNLARLARDYMDRAGFRAIVAGTAADGRDRLKADRPDLVVLDLGLPDGNGLDLLRELRHDGNLPVIILTARGDEVDRIVGLELGADDYVVKPFSPNELVARVRAVLRRAITATEPASIIDAGDLQIDVPRMRVSRDGEAIDLTATEFQLLATMAKEPGRVFTRGQLLNTVHGVMVEAYERAIDAHIKNIRRKLEGDGESRIYIQTVHGVGYRFNDAS
jgi:two-component system alkaline phosphatase synthesis response regulator PhoP